MANFSEYINGNESIEKNNKEQGQEGVEELIDKYSKYSNDKLLNEVLKLTLEKKKKGDLGEGELSRLKETLAPYLNTEQKESLNKIIEMVKNV